MPVSSRRLQAPAGPHGLVLNHTVEHGSSGQCAIISGFHLSPILGKPSLAKAAATPNPHRPTPAVPRVPSSGAFARRPPYTGRPLAPGRHPKPFTKAAIAVRARGRRIRARAAQNTIPHSESTSPRSRQILADILDGVPEDEQAKIGKISSVYTFDVAKLTVPA